MKKLLFVFASLFAISSTFGQVGGPSDSGLPENPAPGKCYAKCVTPDVYETKTVQVMSKAAYKVLKVIPAEYNTVEERVLVKEASKRYEFIPAVYEEVEVEYEAKAGHTQLDIVPASFSNATERIEVKPASARWEYKEYDGCKSEDPLDCQVACWVEYPAEYQTVSKLDLSQNSLTRSANIPGQKATYTKRIIKKAAEVREIEIPAEYKTITKRVLVKDQTVVEEEVPAEYSTVTQEVLVKKGGISVWEEVECELLSYNVLPINYELNSARLTSSARQTIQEKLLTLMKDKPNIKVEISAHTDSRGSKSANQSLSEARAKSVANYLIGQGINSSRLVAKGYGEDRLKNRCADGVSCTEREHAVNRRTEFRILNY